MKKIFTIAILCLMALCGYSQSTNTYEYDNLNRLIKVTYANGAVVQYTYDAVGNRTKKQVNGVYTQYTITASASPTAGGTVSGAGTYTHGSSCTLTATPNTGYAFTKWTKNGTQVSTSASYTFTVTANASYVAVFTQNSYTVSASASPTTGGTVSGAGTYTHGSSCTLTATPNTGYSFTKWTKNGTQVSTNPSYTFTVTANASYVALFEQTVTTVDHIQPLTNGWNWWSTYIDMNGAEGLTLLENSLGANGVMIKSRSSGFVESYEYNGTVGWFGQLTSLSNEQMYKINMNGSGNGTVSGTVSGASAHPITIGYGWNWIGYPLSQSADVNAAMSGFTPSVDDIIKGRNSYTTCFSYGGDLMWFGTLNTLVPGNGYMYQSQSSGTKTLVFSQGKGASLQANVTPENNVYRPESDRFADNMTVTAVVELDGEELRSEKYELAAFVGEECRGSVKMMYVEPMNRYIAFLNVFGEDDEELELRLTDGETTGVSSDRLTYVADGVRGTLSKPAVLRFGTTTVGETPSMVRVYPNPVRERGDLRLQLPVKEGTLDVEISNVLGMRVYKDNAMELIGSEARLTLPASVVPGTYVLKATAQDGTVYYGKLVVE
jgi:YD repeat-containing protein